MTCRHLSMVRMDNDLENDQDPSQWWHQLRRPFADSVALLRQDLTAGRDPEPAVVRDALYHFMREDDENSVQQVYIAMVEQHGQGPNKRLTFDATAGAVWRSLQALRVPVSAAVADQARLSFACSTYWLNTQPGLRRAAPAEGCEARWGTLWRRVDDVLDYTGRLRDRLAELDGREADDEFVVLAVLSGLAIRAAKVHLRVTYADVLWEEMETVLAAFVEATTKREAVAAAVVTPERLLRHLTAFRDAVVGAASQYRGQTPGVMNVLAQWPAGCRWAVRSARARATPDDPAVDLHRCATVLADHWSLQDIREALQVAVDALRLDDDDRGEWGFLSVHRAATVVLSRMADTWASPHLSTSYIRLVELLAAPGVMQRLRDILKDVTVVAHTDWVGLQRTLEAVGGLCRLAELEVAAVRDMEADAQPCHSQAKRARLSTSEERANCARELLAQLSSDGRLPADAAAGDPEGRVVDDYLLAALPCDAPSRCGDRTLARSDGLSVAPHRPPPRYVFECALEVIRQLPMDDGVLARYAAESAISTVASFWNDQDSRPSPPVADLFVPVLYGRRLVDYLGGVDRFLDRCYAPSDELQVLAALLRVEFDSVDLERGAQPPPRCAAEAAAEGERLLELVRRKGAMFECARRGDLLGLRAAVEQGVDVASRDCRGRSLLQAAAEAGQEAVVCWLRRLGAEALDPRVAAGTRVLRDAGT